jgi:hypothetical protein
MPLVARDSVVAEVPQSLQARIDQSWGNKTLYAPEEAEDIAETTLAVDGKARQR